MKRGTLRHELNDGLKSDPQRLQKDIGLVLQDFHKICSAFSYMHTLSPVKFIHQDIKPENILLSDDGEPMLTDFGSVREAEVSIEKRSKALAVSEEAAIFCTMPYRAIELFDPHTGTHLDSRTDVWGIGCLLFAWWFGYSPFECEFVSSGAVKVVECSLSRILAKVPRPPAARASENDIFIADFVEWILVHDMNNRPFSANILERLDRTTVTANRATTAMVPV
jgi:serine/threonine protein kinase